MPAENTPLERLEAQDAAWLWMGYPGKPTDVFRDGYKAGEMAAHASLRAERDRMAGALVSPDTVEEALDTYQTKLGALIDAAPTVGMMTSREYRLEAMQAVLAFILDKAGRGET